MSKRVDIAEVLGWDKTNKKKITAWNNEYEHFISVVLYFCLHIDYVFFWQI